MLSLEETTGWAVIQLIDNFARNVEVYGFFESKTQPRMLFKTNLLESVQSIDHIKYEKEEIVLGLYSGKVLALSERPHIVVRSA